MPECICKGTFTRVDNNGVCRECRENERTITQSNDNDGDLFPGLSVQDANNLPELPTNWLDEPIQNLNGGHILKILLLSNSSINTRLAALENHNKIKDETIKRFEETITSNESKITSLENEISTLKKGIVNQQLHQEQTQRNQLANNLMITGIPDNPLFVDDVSVNEVEEKIYAILQELNADIDTTDYTVKLFDPYTTSDGTVTHSTKLIFKDFQKKKQTVMNAKKLKDHTNDFFKRVYVKNDETKLSRNENYRLRPFFAYPTS